VRLEHGCVRSARHLRIQWPLPACARRCLDRRFRVQWPLAVPALSRLRGTGRLA
jgi:hypothetical protein